MSNTGHISCGFKVDVSVAPEINVVVDTVSGERHSHNYVKNNTRLMPV